MALAVIEGKQELTTLIGTLAVVDSITAVNEQAAVVADSAEQADVAPKVLDSLSTDGQLRSTLDIDKEILEARGESV